MANYFVIGNDSKEYGPVSTDELRKWVAEGRADAQTKVRSEGSTDWRSLTEVPELAAGLGAITPPPLAALPSTKRKLSAMAVLSLVFGALGLFTCGITALVGLILGIIALVKISNSQGALRGKGVALGGTIVSGVFLLLLPFLAAMLLPALAAAKQKAMEINCVNNEKQLALAVKTYSGGHTNHLPPAATWCDAVKAGVGSENVFKCVSAAAASRSNYAFNARLDGVEAATVNPRTVMIFESDAGWNAHGGVELLTAPRHHRKMVVAFADGSVEAVPEAQIGSLRWDP